VKYIYWCGPSLLMEKGDLFWWLVDYHCQVNLKEASPYIKAGVLDNKGGLYKEGRDAGCPYQGVLVVANGSTLADRLVEDHVIHDEPDEFVAVPARDHFFNYLNRQSTEDGAYIFDGSNQRITTVGELNNNPRNFPRDFLTYSRIPRDFVSAGGQLPLSMIGTKTRLAIKLPCAYDNTEAFQIKRSRYGTLGMGKVTHFTKDGLEREFLFDYKPDSSGSFIDPKQGIVGLLRTYQRDGAGTLYRASEEIVDSKALKDY